MIFFWFCLVKLKQNDLSLNFNCYYEYDDILGLQKETHISLCTKLFIKLEIMCVLYNLCVFVCVCVSECELVSVLVYVLCICALVCLCLCLWVGVNGCVTVNSE